MQCRSGLEVVGDADDRIVDVVKSAGLLGFETEVRSLHEQAAVLGANVPAGTQLICDTAAVNAPQNGLSLYVELGGAGVVERSKHEGPRTCLKKGIPVLEICVHYISSGKLLHPVVHSHVVEAGVVLLRVLPILMIDFQPASRSQHVAVTNQAAQSVGSRLLDIIASDKWGKDAGYANTYILTAFLGLTR